MIPRVRRAVSIVLGTALAGAAFSAHAAPKAALAAALPAPAPAPESSAGPSPSPLLFAKAKLKVVKIEGYRDFTSQVLDAKQLRDSSQPAESVTHSMISLFGPDAGGTQALTALPNVYVSGTDNYSATGRQQISIRGIKVGYNSIPGDLETNAITAELDGVPLNSLSQGTGWHSVEIPLGVLMSGENVIVGPGNPSERWYNSMGGTIDFIPVQPSVRAGGKVMLAGGSSSTTDASAVYNTGAINGWTTVFGLATGRSQAIRDTQDSLPADTEEVYAKTRKQLSDGSVSFGAYYQRNHEWRPNMIPVTAQPYVDTEGLGIGSPYSQQTSGFYATLPRSVWHKTILINNWLLWSHLHLKLSSSLDMSNMIWVRIGKVRHYRSNNYLLPTNPLYATAGGNPTNHEHYIERSKTFGDRIAFHERFNRMDTLSYGGYLVMSRAKSDYQGYSTFDGSSLSQPEQTDFNTTTSTYWAAFLQDDFRPLPRLKIVPGIRVVQFITDFANLSPSVACAEYHITGCNYGQPIPTFPVVGGSSVNGQTFQFQSYDTAPDESTDFVKLEPSVGLNYELVRNLNLFANYSVTRHNPNSGNLDRYPVNLATLKPARSEQYDVGLRYAALRLGTMRDVYASIDFFHNLLSDETLTYSVAGLANSPNFTYFGYGAATYKGVDVSLHADFTRHWSGFGNVGYLSSRWNEYQSASSPSGPQPTGYGLPVANSPKDTINAGVTYRFRLAVAKVKATLWDQYIGARYLFDKSTGLPSTLTNPAYNLVNLSLTAKTSWFDRMPGVKGSTFSVQVLNLTNKEYNSTEYVSSGGYFQSSGLPTPVTGYVIANPGAPRLVYASLTMDF
jgi:iron complex outermembrane receptor protein